MFEYIIWLRSLSSEGQSRCSRIYVNEKNIVTRNIVYLHEGILVKIFRITFISVHVTSCIHLI